MTGRWGRSIRERRQSGYLYQEYIWRLPQPCDPQRQADPECRSDSTDGARERGPYSLNATVLSNRVRDKERSLRLLLKARSDLCEVVRERVADKGGAEVDDSVEGRVVEGGGHDASQLLVLTALDGSFHDEIGG